ncbi:outer membrane protein assembly factor BamB family protein [Halosimplex salinum]|uniref:outer membrane protein assembly factor BamB family protein n=1 Tax=Halosimplex salinum TaxID=1710538 RepID=UPI000F46C5EA|nr:PQQ-binding-like beta-propeller repeat protein [Halosimplex salinum]
MPSPRWSRRSLLRRTALGAAVGAAGCATLAGGSGPEPIPHEPPGPDDWPASGYDARNTRYNADATPPRSAPETRWSREFSFCHRPVIRGTRVVVNADDATVGLRATDGERLWESDSEPWGYETPTLGTDRAYVTGTDCAFGIELYTGEETWRGDPCHGANTASGTLANGRLYLEYGGYFSALDETGQVTWASRHDAEGSPAVTEETAYVATAFSVEAVDLTATASEWPWEDPDDDEPAHADDDAATKWSVPPESRGALARIYESPAVAGATVFATTEYDNRPGGRLQALARTDGEERWSISSPPEHRPGDEREDAPDPVGQPVAPVVTPDLVVTSLGDRRIRAVTHDGDDEWTTTVDRDVKELVGAAETILAVTHDRSVETTDPGHATVTAFDLTDGAPLWERRFEDHVEGLAVAGGTVYATAVSERRADNDVAGERLIALG